MSLRKYGPGKFDLVIDEHVYELVLNGFADETLGDADTFGAYDAVRLGDSALEAIISSLKGHPHSHMPNTQEARLIRKNYSAICETTSSGFVHVMYCKTKAEYDKTWKKIERDYDQWSSEAE